MFTIKEENKYLNAWCCSKGRKCLDCRSEGRWLFLDISRWYVQLGRVRLSKATSVLFLGAKCFLLWSLQG